MKDQYYPHLDGLRGVAISLVLLMHFYHLKVGWIGVDLFFVLSGFLITNILLYHNNDLKSYFFFLARRSLRIFPIYFLTLFVVFCVLDTVIAQHIPNFQVLIDNRIYFWTYVQNFFFVYSFEERSSILTHFWALAVEEQFYVFWPLLVYVFKSRNNWLLIISIFLVATSVTLKIFSCNIRMNYAFLPHRMDSLILGGLVAMGLNKGLSIRPKLLLVVMTLMGLLFVFIGIHSDSFLHNTPVMSKIGYPIIGVFFSSLMLLIMIENDLGGRIKAILNARLLKELGKYSYGIYVIHWPIRTLILKLEYLKFLPYSFLKETVMLLITLLLSFVLYHAYEKRFLRLKKYFIS